MKNITKLLTLALMLPSYHAFAACPTDCAASDTECVARMLSCKDDANSSANGAALGLLAAAGLGYILLKDEGTEESKQLAMKRFDEFYRGEGIRITSFDKNYKVSLLPVLASPVNNIESNQLGLPSLLRNNNNFGMIKVQYNFD